MYDFDFFPKVQPSSRCVQWQELHALRDPGTPQEILTLDQAIDIFLLR